MYINPAALGQIGQGARMAGHFLKGLGAKAALHPRLSATLGAGAVGGIHGRTAGYGDPYSSGMGGTLGYGLVGGALGGLPGAALAASTYAVGQGTGARKGGLSKLKALDAVVLGGGAAPQDKAIEDYLRKREARQQLIQSLLNPMPGGYNPSTHGGNI